MIWKANRNILMERGMTLSEVVMAIGIIAFSIPLIVAASGGAHRSLEAAEVDTRSAWVVRDVQRRIINAWSDSASSSHLETPLAFPSAATPEVTWELGYKHDGTFLADGIDQAVYIVTVKAEPYTPNLHHSSAPALALVSIKIEYPAKASPNKRKKLSYQFIAHGMEFHE
ncbi:MAG: type II secretion system protein [Verrucomicrobiota bacterium]